MDNRLKETLLQSAKDFTPVFVRQGEYLIRQGEEADCAYIVVSGRLHAVVETTGAPDRVVSEIGEGETVGELAMLTGKKRSSSVRAARDSRLLRFTKDQFEKHLLENPAVLLELTRLIAQRLSSRATDITFKPKNILVMPAGEDTSLFRDLGSQLRDGLSTRGRVKYLDLDVIRNEFTAFKTLEDSETDLDSHAALVQWFNILESEYDYLIYVTSSELDWWTKRCIRTADRIFLAGNSSASQQLNPIEQYLHERKSLTHTELVLIHPRRERRGIGTDKWVSARKVSRSHHIEINHKGDYQRLVRHILGEAFGLVLSGGGARGLAHVGVLMAMDELGIPIDMIGGSSIGSIVAGLHAIGLTPREQVETFKSFIQSFKVKKFTFPWISLLDTRPIEKALKHYFGDNRIEDSFTDYFCISCNLNTAEKVVHTEGFLWEAIRASAAIPGVFAPKFNNNALFVDGAIMDNFPSGEMRKRGANTLFMVDVAPRYDLVMTPDLEHVPSGWQMLKALVLGEKAKQKFPNIMEILMRTIMLNSISRGSDSGSIANLVLHPPVENLSILDFSKIDETVENAYNYARPLLENFKREYALR